MIVAVECPCSYSINDIMLKTNHQFLLPKQLETMMGSESDLLKRCRNVEPKLQGDFVCTENVIKRNPRNVSSAIHIKDWCKRKLWANCDTDWESRSIFESAKQKKKVFVVCMDSRETNFLIRCIAMVIISTSVAHSKSRGRPHAGNKWKNCKSETTVSRTNDILLVKQS